MLTHGLNLRGKLYDQFVKGGIGNRIRQAVRRFAEAFDPASAPRRRRRRWATRTTRLAAEPLETRAMLSGNGFGFDDFPDAGDWSTAAEISMEPAQPAALIQGSLETRGDTDLFQFVAPTTGRAVVRLGTPASRLDPYLYAYDGTSDHQLLASNDDYCGQDSRVAIRVQEGETYFFLADNYRNGSMGSYTLGVLVVADDHADLGDWSAASEIHIDPATGNGSVDGSLERRRDTDLFRFVAVSTGQATIRLDTPDSELNPVLYVAGGDSQNPVIAGNNDYNGHDSQVTIDVVEGETYFVLADSYQNRSAGAYTLSVDMPPVDDHPNFGESDSTEILIDPATGNGSIAGALEQHGDSDVFRFVASTTGQAVIRLDASDGNLNTHLFVGAVTPIPQLLGQNRNDDGTGSQVTIDVVEGQTYFIVAASAENQSVGSYTVSVDMESDNRGRRGPAVRQPASSPESESMESTDDQPNRQIRRPASTPASEDEESTDDPLSRRGRRGPSL